MRKLYLLFLGMLLIACPKLSAQISITSTGTTFTENFDGIGTSATATLPTGFKIGPDWSTGTTATTKSGGTSGTGVLNSTSGGGIYNFANGVTATATDRCLGFLNSTSFGTPQSIVLRFTNNTGSTINAMTISFDYEKYRTGTSAFSWTFFHGNTTNPTIAATAGDQAYIADGANAVVNPPTTISKTVDLTNLSIANGADYYLRWTFTGGPTNGQGIGIDNFSITAKGTDATLSGLSLSSGALLPTFSSSTTSYTASVLNAVSSIAVTPTANAAAATITVSTNPVTSGSPSTPISLVEGPNTITTVVTAQDGITTKTYTITVTRAVAGAPTVIQNSALSDFGNICINTTTGTKSFTIEGADLDGSNISLAAIPGFTYSSSVGGPYTSTLSFSYTGNSFTGKTIYVSFNPTSVQTYDGNITVNGGGIAPVNILVTGSGINTATTVTTGASSAVTPGTATIAGNITGTGCSAITNYGFEYSIVPGFPIGMGTQAAANNLSGGNFSVGLSGLAPNQKYYYKAYVTTTAGTTYGAEQTFVNTTLPVPMASQPGMSYTQDFSDIASWTNVFISGNGANHFNGLSASGTGTIPNPNVLTTSTASFQGNSTSGGVQKGTDQSPATQSIVLLSTGSTDNTSSAAIDFYMDFTGVNAGTLSFDWATINNSTGDRNGSLRVYASIDGTTWTELTFADVLNITNNSPTSGSQSNIALPTLFNNSATARLRFYYHNAAGGITPTGSRPKISIDNLKVTAVATTPCVSPTAAPTTLVFGTITDVSIQGSFTAASPTPDNYLVIASTSSSLTSNPVNGQNYNIGDNVGDGMVIANGSSTSFTATGLNASTSYYFFIYSLNSICTGGPLYYATALTDQATTNAGLPPCAAPAAQPTALTFGTTTPGSIQGSFTATTADEYLVLASLSASLSSNPVNAQSYAAGDVIGNAIVVSRSTATTFTASNLSPNTTYYFYVFSLQLQNCLNGPAYNSTSPLTASQNTLPLPPCITPSVQPASLTFNASNTSISGTFAVGNGADDYLVIRSTASTLSATPVNNTDYNVGDNFGGGIVIANTTTTSFLTTNLTPGTTYYFFVFAANKNCTGGTQYLTTAPLTGSQATSNMPVYNYYFGTLHSHSDYSDGNQDNPGYTPADDYAYAKNAQCMDFLGISEHNHYSSANNPGNQITNYHSGSVQANAFTAANPNFLALYGMEWGVISGGGHVVVYGDGMDDLFGWESGSGGWGSSNNYDIYVAKSDYTGPNGLFKTINDRVAKNTFATLAHPNSSDYNNLLNTAYNAMADNAITGTAVESGPATSTNTTYSNPGSSMSYLGYYQKLLALGYHLGPVVDHDNHNTTFGHTTYSRTAVLAPSLSKTDIIKAYRDMHFYATQDCDTKVDYSINTHMMGSIFTDRNAPIITVNMTDASTLLSNAVINVMFGTPGSGVTAQKIASVTGSSMTYQDNNLANLATGYYYLDITNGSARIITSPIWYTRNDNSSSLPVTLLTFTGKMENGQVKLGWTTAQETNSKEFVIERSTDGRNFGAIGKIAAAGNTDHATTYSYIDAQPVYGVNYYRLKQVDIDGKTTYSAIVTIKTDKTGGFLVGPNPVRNSVTIYRQGNKEAARVELLDVNGKLMQQLNIGAAIYATPVNVSSLSKGIYLIKLTTSKGIQTEKIMVE